MIRVISHLIPANKFAPNNPRYPLLIYTKAVVIEKNDPAARFEELFKTNNWINTWRNGILSMHHFHSSAHEVLGIYSGEVTILMGGEQGVLIAVSAGDVIIVPAGVAHKKISVKGVLGVVGAYPMGQEADTCMSPLANVSDAARRVAVVRLPRQDPVYGVGGPLLEHWRPIRVKMASS